MSDTTTKKKSTKSKSTPSILDKFKKLVEFDAWHGFLMLALTLIYIFGLTSVGGPIGQFLVQLVRPVVGSIGSWLIAATMIVGTVHLLSMGRWSAGGRITRLAFWGIPLLLAAWESAMHLRTFYWDERALNLTGLVGLWVGRSLRLLVGDAAAGVAFGLLVVLSFIILKVSPITAFKTLWNAVSESNKRRKSRLNGDQPLYPKEKEKVAPVQITDDDLPAPEETPVPIVATSFEPSVPPGSQIDLGLDDAPPLPQPKNYKLPPIDLLDQPSDQLVDENFREIAAQRITKTLDTFGIPCHVNDVITGPAVTRVEVVLGEGIRVKQVETMEKDIAYTLPAKRVRVEAPIPGKTAVGIEFPNARTNIVRLREIVEHSMWGKARAPLTMALAKNLYNKPVLADLGKMPHLLVAGQTGSGKSVCLHAIIMSLLYRMTPDQIRLILIDPKMVEFGFYEGLPHLLTPVVNEMTDAVNALRWSVQEMRDRYRKLKKAKARNILVYNQQVTADQRMPFIVIVIDEMADLIAQEGYEIEACITALTQLARAVGIHLILATQRPSVKIITGNIKANIPVRIALNVASQIDSRTIIDGKGAENLLGNGDMLFKPVDCDAPTRAQGVYIDDEEIKRVVSFLSLQGEPEYDDDVVTEHAPSRQDKTSAEASDILTHEKELFRSALMVILGEGQASTSMLQTKLGMGYPKARRLMEQMSDMGLVGPKNGSKPREVVYSEARALLNQIEGAGSVANDDLTAVEDNNVDEILEVV